MRPKTNTRDYVPDRVCKAGVDPGYLERGFICTCIKKEVGFALLNLNHFS